MSALFIYLLKANIALCLFYLAYRLGLRRMTFYTLNRFFLLGGIAFSSMFPLVDVNDFISRSETLAAQVTYYVPDWTTLQQVESFTVWTLLEYTFWAGVAVMGLRLLAQMVSLLVLHLRTEPDRLFGQQVRRMKGSMTPFSFFRKIYVNPELHTETELISIVRHEQVHVKEWHTADIMMGEINNVFYWFNPGAWLMKGAIRENLEFLADRAILRSGINRKEYQYSLIQVNASQYAAGITNSFNLSHIKNRIFMMNKSRTSGIQLYRYGVLGCIVCGVLLTLNYTKAGAAVHDAIQEVRTALVPDTAEKDTVPAATSKGDNYTTITGKPVINTGTVDVNYKTADGKPAINSGTVDVNYNAANAKPSNHSGTFGVYYDAANAKPAPAILSLHYKTADDKANPVLGSLNYVIVNDKPANNFLSDTLPRSGEVVEVKLAGKTAGVQLTPKEVEVKSGKTTAGTLILGRNPDPNERPLIVLDGIPQKPDGSSNPLKDIDPNNIESISVLKDAAASAIYGPAGNNGVIIVTTKRPGINKSKPMATSVPREFDVVREVRTSVDSVTGKTTSVITVTGTRRPTGNSGHTVAVQSQNALRSDSLYRDRYAKTMAGVREMERKHDPRYTLRVGKPSDSVQNLIVAAYGRHMVSGKNVAETIQTEHYPNPTDGVVTFAYSLSKPGKGNIRVTDINGREIYRKSIDGLSGSQKEQINLSGKPAGTYIVTLTHDGSKMTSRIVKQ